MSNYCMPSSLIGMLLKFGKLESLVLNFLAIKISIQKQKRMTVEKPLVAHAFTHSKQI